MSDTLALAAELQAVRRPFALATVVRVDRPVSAKPGDRAVITSDGELRGWVGGSCSEPIVVREALAALADGQPRLVQIRPPGGAADRDEPGVVVEITTCESEGGLDVFVEPRRVRPSLVVAGSSPVARKVAELAAALDYRVDAALDGPSEHVPHAEDKLTLEGLAGADLGPQDAVVVATMNRYDDEALAAALATGAGYVGLVASRPRADKLWSLLRSRGVSEDALERVHSPAGLDLGPSSQDEIALAIVAEVVAERHRTQEEGEETFCAPESQATAVDPICGMTVAVVPGAISAPYEGVTYYFCAPGCRDAFLRDPSGALEGRATGS